MPGYQETKKKTALNLVEEERGLLLCYSDLSESYSQLGPLRINLSRHGIGYSVGIKGARSGRSSQGRAYVQAGRGGLYERKFLTPRAR